MEFRGQLGAWTAEAGSPREGGQATVYPARMGGRRAAVKVARTPGPWMGNEREALTRLSASGVATRDWLVELIDHGISEDKREFLVLEWFPDSLADWLGRGPPIERILRVLQSAAEAVARLHAAAGLRDQYLHLDLKPWNFLIDDAADPARVVLADLGGVKRSRLHVTTQFLGQHTPGFAPLEQELSLARPADASVDVHGLAATVYAALCGRLPDARGASGGLTHAGRRLDMLQRLASREAEEEVEFQRLRRLPVEELVALEERVALTTGDAARLQNRLAEALAGRCPDAGAVAQRAAGALLPALRAGLAPDPRLREKRVAPIYAALAEAADQVAHGAAGGPRGPGGGGGGAAGAAGVGPGGAGGATWPGGGGAGAGRAADEVESDAAGSGGGAGAEGGGAGAGAEGGPGGRARAVDEEDSAVRRRLPTAAEAVATYLARQVVRGERSVGRTRLVLLPLAFASELLEHSAAEWASFSLRVWGTTGVVVLGLVATLALLRVPAARVTALRVPWISVALDALLVTALSLPGVLWPPEHYLGQAHLPSFAIYAIAISAASLRFSGPILRFGVACNALCASGLLLLDANIGAALLPISLRDVLIWFALFFGSAVVADAVTVRSRRMVQEGAGSAIQAERARQALGVYVSEEIADRAMSTEVLSPGGHRQAVAVLYCELQGFSTYAERVAPERLLAELNAFLAAMVGVVRAEGGVIDRYLGDAILVVFGVPRPTADASSRAVLTAARMTEALVGHNAERAGRGLRPLRMAIGVHAGEVVVGNVGTPERMQYTVVGDVVNLATALQRSARQLDVAVLVSDVVAHTVGVLPGNTQLVPAGTVALGGRTDATPVWRLGG